MTEKEVDFNQIYLFEGNIYKIYCAFVAFDDSIIWVNLRPLNNNLDNQEGIDPRKLMPIDNEEVAELLYG